VLASDLDLDIAPAIGVLAAPDLDRKALGPGIASEARPSFRNCSSITIGRGWAEHIPVGSHQTHGSRIGHPGPLGISDCRTSISDEQGASDLPIRAGLDPIKQLPGEAHHDRTGIAHRARCQAVARRSVPAQA
jgi:hypothetical protein